MDWVLFIGQALLTAAVIGIIWYIAGGVKKIANTLGVTAFKAIVLIITSPAKTIKAIKKARTAAKAKKAAKEYHNAIHVAFDHYLVNTLAKETEEIKNHPLVSAIRNRDEAMALMAKAEEEEKLAKELIKNLKKSK